MSLELKDMLLGNYKAVRAMGDKIIDADAQLVVDGLEKYRFLAKEFPHPAPLSSGEAAESFGPNGQKFWQPTNANTAQQGSIILYCYADGHTEDFLSIIKNNLGGKFNALVYEGTMEAHLRAYRIRDAILTLETGTRSQENKTQILTLTGQLSFHFFDEREDGNVKTLYGGLGSI